MRLVGPALQVLTAGLCAWEAIGIVTRRIPTLSELSARHRWLAPALVAGLAVHLAWPQRGNAPA